MISRMLETGCLMASRCRFTFDGQGELADAALSELVLLCILLAPILLY